MPSPFPITSCNPLPQTNNTQQDKPTTRQRPKPHPRRHHQLPNPPSHKSPPSNPSPLSIPPSELRPACPPSPPPSSQVPSRDGPGRSNSPKAAETLGSGAVSQRRPTGLEPSQPFREIISACVRARDAMMMPDGRWYSGMGS
ncbi:hypothetical protein QBC39DRAFT_8419 [Podospora conica]|nr:hypothetical protein QBC39DRAFT_8419 [Schizothecium conicum]